MKCGLCEKRSGSHDINGYSLCHECWSNTFYKDMYPEKEKDEK